MEIQVFLWKGQGCIPKLGWGNCGDTCEQGNDEGVLEQTDTPEVRKTGVQGDPRPLRGFWRGSSEEGVGGRPALPHPLFHGKHGGGGGGCFSFEKTLGIPPGSPCADFGVIPVRSGWVLIRI